ncbi:signal peptidase I [Alicyclobacillus dauci]|uniref:Signal peptidase I n=1 Tax=Alicyclobacillus dauci TaxID=1475485 RepID=A0ABY6Z1Q6_9BACL|nr:signal peptidase I [Alicyclobacillus dauci]WAH36767.1 signal peptidase I [Alicyclobacillus dauci]
MIKKVLGILNIVITGLLGVLMVGTMFLAISSRLNHGQPQIFGQRMYEVLSGSMTPTFHTGSVIFENPKVNTKNLKVGDVITFRIPISAEYGPIAGTIVTHRIKSITTTNGQEWIKTKGDANKSADPWTIPEQNVIATYDNFTIPYVGYYITYLKTKWGIAAFTILPGAILLFSSVWGLIRQVRQLQKSPEAKPEVTVEANPSGISS